MSDKLARQRALLRLVRSRSVASQQEIVAQMRSHGFRVTQASISRDVRELGLIKASGRYVPFASVQPAGPGGDLVGRIGGLVTRIIPAGANLIVLHSTVGAAGNVAAALDAQHFPDVLSTVAGDDTVFIAVRSRAAQGRVMAALKSFIRPRLAEA